MATVTSKNSSANSSAVNNGTSDGFPSFHRPPFSDEELKIIATSFFSIISVLGVIGNSMVIITLIRWRDMRTPCNYLIANISIADLVVCLFMAPLRVIEQYTNGWIFGEALCYVFAPLQDALVSVSVFTFTAIALERYRAIINPFQPKLNKTQVKILIVLIWIGCYAGAGLPLAFFVSHLKVSYGYICFAAIPKQDFYMFAIYLVTVYIALPLMVQMFAYIRVIVTLRKKDAIDKSSAGSDSSRVQRKISQHRMEKKRRLTKMLIVLMLVFHVCYVPRGIIMLVYEFAPLQTRTVAFAFINLITMLLYYVKHIMNPIILFGMSTDFRVGFAGVCRCISGEHVQLNSSTFSKSPTVPTPLQTLIKVPQASTASRV